MLAATRSALIATFLATPVLAQVQQAAAAEPPPEAVPALGELVLPEIDRLTIGGQYRLRFEDRINYDFDSGETFDSDFFVQRVRINLDFEIDEDLRVFVQLQDARFWGEETNATIDRTSPGLDLHQAFVEIQDLGLIGGESRIGRQILNYGDQRLVGGLEWLNQGRSFNALRHRWSGGGEDGWAVDLFGAQLTETPGTTAIEDDAMFFGGYATFATDDDGSQLDVFAFLLQDDETSNQMEETRITVGLRALQQLGPVELGAELATQTGEVDDADIPLIDTFAVHTHAKVGLARDGKVYLRAEFDAASGNDGGTAENERFNNLFPTAHAFLGIMDLVLWENILHGGLQFGAPTGKNSRITAAIHDFSAFEASDSVGGPAGSLTTGGAGFSRDLGQEFDVVWHQDLPVEGRSFRSHVEIGYGLFVPGDGVADSFGSDSLAHFVYVQGGVKF